MPHPPLNTDTLVARHAGAWRAATRHPFLDAVRDGTLPGAAFGAWLAQDYLFVGDLLAFQARLLARAPRGAQAFIAGGLVALEAELSWFEQHAAAQRVSLTRQRHPTTEAYRALLTRLDAAPFPVAMVALWAIERAYLEAWQRAAPGALPYRDFVAHWTVPEFAGYVTALAAAADAAVAERSADDARTHAAASPHAGAHQSDNPLPVERDSGSMDAEAAFLAVADLERAFWEMAWSA